MRVQKSSLKPVLSLLLAATCGLLIACNKGGSQEAAKSEPQAAPAPVQAPAPAAAPEAAPAPQAPAPAAPQPPPAAQTPPPSGPQPTVSPMTAKMDFTLPLQPVSDPPTSFSAYRGKPVLLFYFGPTCPHCQKALPEVQAYGDEIRARGVQTLAIANARSNPDEIRGFIRTYNARIPVYWDSERKFGSAYDIKLLPTLYVVSAEGKVHRLDNFAGKASLDALLSKI